MNSANADFFLSEAAEQIRLVDASLEIGDTRTAADSIRLARFFTRRADYELQLHRHAVEVAAAYQRGRRDA